MSEIRNEQSTVIDIREKLARAAKHNPLINPEGDTTPVCSVLRTVEHLLHNVDGGNLELETSQTFGIAMILATCRHALESMEPITTSWKNSEN